LLNVVSVQNGKTGGIYAGELRDGVQKTLFLMARGAESQNAPQMVRTFTEEVIRKNMEVYDTYYIPRVDVATGRPLNPDIIQGALKTLGTTWVKDVTGAKFTPYSWGGTGLRQEPFQEMVKDATNLVWVMSPDGDGVRRAVKLPNVNVYELILDKDKNPYEVKFRDVLDLSRYERFGHGKVKR
jgi:hypothetical protein